MRAAPLRLGSPGFSAHASKRPDVGEGAAVAVDDIGGEEFDQPIRVAFLDCPRSVVLAEDLATRQESP
jgi:hypothetical protein